MRKFRIDTSKKIQAAVDLNPQHAIDAQLSSFKSQLIVYAEPRIAEVYEQADAYLQQIITENAPTSYKLVSFKSYLNPDSWDTPIWTSKYPTILPGLVYEADEDDAWTWINIFYDDNRSKYSEVIDILYAQLDNPADSGQYYLGNPDIPGAPPCICAPDIEDFATFVSILLIAEKMLNPMTAENAVELGKQLIDGYCDFVEKYCRERTDAGLQAYLEEEEI
jgi:hypothetical protein